MQSKISFFNKSIFKKNITHFWPLWLGYFIISLFEIPFGIFLSGRSLQYYDYTAEMLKSERTYEYVNLMRMLIQPGVIFLVALLAAMVMLSYLYNSRSANMLHSLPVRREELFFTNYLSGLSFLLVPKLIATLLGVFVCAGLGITEPQYLMIAFLYIAAMLTFFYSFAFVVGMIVGQFWAFPVVYLFLNFMEVIMEAVIRCLLVNLCFGIGYNWKSSKFSVLSPVVYLTSHATIDIEYLMDGTYKYTILGAKCVLIYFLLSIPLMLLALFIYKKKAIETVGDLVTVKWLKPVSRWVITICGGLAAAMIFGQIFYDTVSAAEEFAIVVITAILNSIVFFFIAQMFLDKKFKVFSKKRFLEAGIGSLILTAVLCAIEFDVFGIEKKVPDVSDVVWVGFENNNSVLTDKEEIKQVTDIQKQIISEKKELEEKAHTNPDTYFNLMISYQLKDGTQLNRMYNIPFNDEKVSDEKSELAQVIELLAKPKNYMSTLFGKHYKMTEPKSGYLETYAMDTEGNVVENDISFDGKNAKLLYDAIKEDINEGNFKKSIAFNMCYSDESRLNKEVYANSIMLDFYNKKGIIYPYNIMNEFDSDEYYGISHRTDPTYADGAYITINEECKNTIEALKKIGNIQSEEDLISYKKLNEQYQQMEN